MTSRLRIAAALALAVVTFPALAQQGPPATKEGTVGAQLLLPLYLVDTVNPFSQTTLWAVRNESPGDVELQVSYYGTDAPQQPQRTDVFELGPKEIQTVNVAFVADLQVDPDNFARGYVTFATTGGEAVIHGDYFLLDDDDNFASGARLVNIDPASDGNDLCNRFSMRFLDSTLLFDSGTIYTVWIQADEPLAGEAFSYFVYDEAGGDEQLSNSFPASDVAFQISAADLMSGPGLDLEFGAIEFQFPPGVIGHISAVMSAFGRFSAGYEATCLDPT